MRRVRPWAVGALIAIVWGFVAFVAASIWWLSFLPALLNPGITFTDSSGPVVNPPTLMPSIGLGVLLVVVGSLAAVLLAFAVYHLFRKAMAPALFAVLAGPTGALLFQIGLNLYGSTIDPPVANVGTVLGMQPLELVGTVLLIGVPAGFAVVTLVVLARRDASVSHAVEGAFDPIPT